MTAQDRMARVDGLFDLLGHLVAGDFAGHPLCAEVDPELFYPEVGETAKVVKAKAICAGCEIREACAAYAVRRGEAFGVWGGTTPVERQELRRARRAAQRQAAA